MLEEMIKLGKGPRSLSCQEMWEFWKRKYLRKGMIGMEHAPEGEAVWWARLGREGPHMVCDVSQRSSLGGATDRKWVGRK